jgi:hypothetical protein
VSRLDGSMVREGKAACVTGTHVLLSPTVSHNRTTERSAPLRTPHYDNSGNREGNPGSAPGSRSSMVLDAGEVGQQPAPPLLSA